MAELYYYRVNGMRTEACAKKTEAVVSKLQGVEFVEVDLETGMAIVKGDIAIEAVTSAIDAAGYNAILIAE